MTHFEYSDDPVRGPADQRALGDVSAAAGAEEFRHPRLLDPLEQRMYDEHTAGTLRARLVIGNQSFGIDSSDHEPDEPGRPDWYRRQLAVALARLVRGERVALRHRRTPRSAWMYNDWQGEVTLRIIEELLPEGGEVQFLGEIP